MWFLYICMLTIQFVSSRLQDDVSSWETLDWPGAWVNHLESHERTLPALEPSLSSLETGKKKKKRYTFELGSIIRHIPPGTIPPVGTHVSNVTGGPYALPTRTVGFCIAHMQRMSGEENKIQRWLNTTMPTHTALVYYTGVIEAASIAFKLQHTLKCDVWDSHSMTLPALVEQKIIQPLNPFFQTFVGIPPHTDMPIQSYNDLYDGVHWWGIPEMFQTLAASVNMTTINRLGLVPPPPISNATIWPDPNNQWDWARARDYVNAMYYQAKVEEPWIMEECMIDQHLVASGMHVDVPLITADGSCGWRDERFIQLLKDVWIPMIQDKPWMVARWINLNSTMTQQYMTTPADQWPPSRTFLIPRGTCTLATAAHGFSTVFSGNRPEMRTVRSPGKRNTMQTWAYSIWNATTQPDVAWSFLASRLRLCEDATSIASMVSSNAIPIFMHCLNQPAIQANINNPNNIATANRLAERLKAVPFTYPQSSLWPNAFRYNNDSPHLILFAELWRGPPGSCGVLPTENLQDFFANIPYSRIHERTNKGGVLYPTCATFDADSVARWAAKRASDVVDYIRKPRCQFPANAQVEIDKCDNDDIWASLRVKWNPSHVDQLCLANEYANAILKEVVLPKTTCPHLSAKSPAGMVILSVAWTLLVVLVAVGAIWFVQRKKRMFRASSWFMSMALWFGAVLVDTSLFALVYGNCTAFFGLLSFGLTLVLWSMLLKLYRLHRMFAPKLKIHVKPELTTLLSGMAIAMTKNLVYFLLWVFLRGQDQIPMEVEQLGDGTYILPVLQCNDGPGWLVLVWLMDLLVFWSWGMYLGWTVRKAPGDFSDSKYLVFTSMWLVMILIPTIILSSQKSTQSNRVLVKALVPILLVVGELVFYLAARPVIFWCEPNEGEGHKEGTLLPARDEEIHGMLAMPAIHKYRNDATSVVQVAVTNGTNLAMSNMFSQDLSRASEIKSAVVIRVQPKSVAGS